MIEMLEKQRLLGRHLYEEQLSQGRSTFRFQEYEGCRCGNCDRCVPDGIEDIFKSGIETVEGKEAEWVEMTRKRD